LVHWKKINKINKPLAKLTKREKTQINTDEKNILKQIPLKFIGLLKRILRTYTPINFKIWKKWTNFWTHMTYQN
jgi:hypothetical protein